MRGKLPCAFSWGVGGGVALVFGVVGPFVPNSSSEYPTFLEALVGVLEGALAGVSFILLGDFSNDSVTWTGEERPLRSAPERCSVVGYSQFIHHDTMLEHKGVHKCRNFLSTLAGALKSHTLTVRNVFHNVHTPQFLFLTLKHVHILKRNQRAAQCFPSRLD